MIPTQEAREDCRREVLSYLADRPAVALPRDTIGRGLKSKGSFEDAEILHACAFLVSLGLLKEEISKLGSTKYYQVTAEGTLHHERG